MCGFVVVTRARGRGLLDEGHVTRMRDRLAHRGPDEASLETIDGWVTLGHRRLSIIDVGSSQQPLRSEDGGIVCVFNGEIYNFAELRGRLRALGHTFTTGGDGEVIVHGYEAWGVDVFARLEGMFAVALVDRAARRVVIARDRFGIKPAFYRQDDGELAVASEIKALLPPNGAPLASHAALALGSVRMHVPWPLTAFDGIFRIPPGTVLQQECDGEVTFSRFAPMYRGRRRERGESTPEAALEVLRGAIARQMVADVPVGAFLSGGIDSTLIVSLMREVTGGEIHTFSIRTLDHDESDVAARTAQELHTDHHTIGLEAIKFDDLVQLPRLYDEPFAETSALGVRALSRFAREHVKVALSGDGGDEVFGGYSSYRWIRIASTLSMPSISGRLAHELLSRRAWPAAIRRLLRGILLAGEDPETAQRDATTLTWASNRDTRALSESLSLRIAACCGADVDDLDAASRCMVADRLERLPNAMLAKVDIASMSASLEVRVPLLDDRVVSFADSVAIGDLVGARQGKRLLRKVLDRLPGGRVAWDRKRGFSLPLDRWMKSPGVAPRLDELFGDRAATLRDLTNTDVPGLWNRFRAGNSQFSDGTAAMQLLWFANVALWAELFSVRTASSGISISALPIA